MTQTNETGVQELSQGLVDETRDLSIQELQQKLIEVNLELDAFMQKADLNSVSDSMKILELDIHRCVLRSMIMLKVEF